MASVDLGRAELSLLSDVDGLTRVVIPSLMAAPYTFGRDRASVRFLGDAFPTGVHGEGRAHTYALTCRYARSKHAELLALQQLLDAVAPAAPDRRLLLRTHFALAAGLNVAVAVELTGPLQVVPAGPTTDVTIPVEVVEHSFYEA